MSTDAEKLISALRQGPIRAIGGIAYSADMQRLMSTTDLRGAIQELGQNGISVHRTDAGGSPTWDINWGVEEDAKRIINFLLENDGRRSCGMCEREFGVHDPDASHGNCKRHTLASYEQMIRMYPQNQAKILPLMQKIEAQPDSSFPPDLAEHPEIVTALGKKDFATHDQETKAYMDQFHRARGEQPV